MYLLGIIDIPDWILILISMLGIIYIYATWNYGFWESQNVATIKPYPLIGSWSGVGLLKDVGLSDLKNTRKYGKVYGYYERRIPYLMVNDLDMLKMILIKDFSSFESRRSMPLGGKMKITKSFMSNLTGDEWRSSRAVLTPTFTSGRLRQMAVLIDESARNMVNSISNDVKKHNGIITVKDRVGVFAMDVIASCCFGTSINTEDPDDPFIQHSKALFQFGWNPVFILLMVAPKLIELLEISMLPPKCLDYFETVAKKVINYRRSEKIRRNDFLQLLLDAQEKENEGKLLDDSESKKSVLADESVAGGWRSHKVLDENGIIANALLFLIAGFDTTSNAISFVVYLLALNPDCQQKLVDEIDQAIEEHGKLTPDVILALPYLEMVLSETLRIYPPGIRLERVCSKDYKIGDIFIRKGCMVAAGVYSIHHDPEIYPEPSKFDPERFSYENKSKRHPLAYIPFGVGPRICIANRFALMEIKICLAHIFSKFRASKCDKTEIPLKMKTSIPFLFPVNGVTVNFEPRS